MVDRTDMIFDMVRSNGERVEELARAVAEVGSHCATLVERTAHLASREDLSTAIRLHAGDCKASRIPQKPRNANGNMGRMIKAIAAFLAVVAAAISAYLGFSPPSP